MNRVLSTLVLLVWGLWLGSIGGVFIAVISLSHTFQPTTPGSQFVPAASNLFHLYELIQLCLAAAALLATFAWQLCRGATRFKVMLFTVFALATISAVVEKAYVSQRIDELQASESTHTDEFKKMHGLSFALYSGNALLLLIGGAFIGIGIARESRERMVR